MPLTYSIIASPALGKPKELETLLPRGGEMEVARTWEQEGTGHRSPPRDRI